MSNFVSFERVVFENLGGFFMSGALMNKVWDLFGMDSAEAEEYEEEDEE